MTVPTPTHTHQSGMQTSRVTAAIQRLSPPEPTTMPAPTPGSISESENRQAPKTQSAFSRMLAKSPTLSEFDSRTHAEELQPSPTDDNANASLAFPSPMAFQEHPEGAIQLLESKNEGTPPHLSDGRHGGALSKSPDGDSLIENTPIPNLRLTPFHSLAAQSSSSSARVPARGVQVPDPNLQHNPTGTYSQSVTNVQSVANKDVHAMANVETARASGGTADTPGAGATREDFPSASVRTGAQGTMASVRPPAPPSPESDGSGRQSHAEPIARSAQTAQPSRSEIPISHGSTDRPRPLTAVESVDSNSLQDRAPLPQSTVQPTARLTDRDGFATHARTIATSAATPETGGHKPIRAAAAHSAERSATPHTPADPLSSHPPIQPPRDGHPIPAGMQTFGRPNIARGADPDPAPDAFHMRPTPAVSPLQDSVHKAANPERQASATPAFDAEKHQLQNPDPRGPHPVSPVRASHTAARGVHADQPFPALPPFSNAMDPKPPSSPDHPMEGQARSALRDTHPLAQPETHATAGNRWPRPSTHPLPAIVPSGPEPLRDEHLRHVPQVTQPETADDLPPTRALKPFRQNPERLFIPVALATDHTPANHPTQPQTPPSWSANRHVFPQKQAVAARDETETAASLESRSSDSVPTTVARQSQAIAPGIRAIFESPTSASGPAGAAQAPAIDPLAPAHAMNVDPAAMLKDLSRPVTGAGQTVMLDGQPSASEVAVRVVRHLQVGIARTEIRLDPPELGRIIVNVERADDLPRTGVQVIVDNPETFEILARDGREFLRTLQNAGLDVRERDISWILSSGGQDGSARHGSGHASTARSGAPELNSNRQGERDQAETMPAISATDSEAIGINVVV